MPYEPTDNFTSRLKVETTYPDKVIDHRSGEFYDREYRRNMQADPKPTEGAGFPNMQSVTQPSKPKGGVKQRTRKKTASDTALEAAHKKDLSKRNIK